MQLKKHNRQYQEPSLFTGAISDQVRKAVSSESREFKSRKQYHPTLALSDDSCRLMWSGCAVSELDQNVSLQTFGFQS